MEFRDDVCLSLGKVDFNTALSLIHEVPLVELRLDLLSFTDEEYKQLYSTGKNILATCRSLDSEVVEFYISRAIWQGCRFIDIGHDIPNKVKTRLLRLISSHSCRWIASYHNFVETPNSKELQRVYRKLYRMNPTYIKIATMCNSSDDMLSIFSLYQNTPKAIAFGMGERGKVSRLMAPVLGAPFTFASLDGRETASGQLPYETVVLFLNTYSHGNIQRNL